MTINTLDIIFIAVIVLFVIRCYVKGFASEILSMAAIVLAVLCAVFFYKYGAQMVRAKILPDANILADIIAFLGIFLIVFTIVKIVEIMVKGIIEKINTHKLDRFLGVIFGLIEGIAIVCFVLMLLNAQPVFDLSKLLQESFFARIFLPIIIGRENYLNV